MLSIILSYLFVSDCDFVHWTIRNHPNDLSCSIFHQWICVFIQIAFNRVFFGDNAKIIFASNLFYSMPFLFIFLSNSIFFVYESVYFYVLVLFSIRSLYGIFFYTIGTLVSIVRYLSIYLYNSMNLFLFFFRFEHLAEIFSYPIYIIEKSNSALWTRTNCAFYLSLWIYESVLFYFRFEHFKVFPIRFT